MSRDERGSMYSVLPKADELLQPPPPHSIHATTAELTNVCVKYHDKTQPGNTADALLLGFFLWGGGGGGMYRFE